MKKLVMVLMGVLLFTGCSSLCPCPNKNLYFRIKINPMEVGCSGGENLYQFILVREGTLKIDGDGVYTKEEMITYIQGTSKVIYQVMPTAVQEFSDEDIKAIRSAR